ncbi:MAG: hypothetical protein QOH36_1308 [Actinomycetota bacterium]|nr:hypothetical protein [Actinomycetota bacterium]
MSDYPFPLADPGDQGRPPVPTTRWDEVAIRARRTVALVARPRRLAIVDSHFPWRLSGFRYHEAEEVFRRLPDTLFFSLYRLTDPFPAPVHPLAEFPRVAPAAGVTDVLMTFLNFSAGVLGVAADASVAPVPGARSDISLWPVLERWGIRAHATLYRGGGLFPDTTPDVLLALGRRCTTVFTSVPEVVDVLPDAVATVVPVPGDFYAWQPRPDDGPADLRLVFVGDDRPRKGLATLLDAMADLGPGFSLDVVGPHERHGARLEALGAVAHGWLAPAELREVLGGADVVVAPATSDRPEDGYGDTGMVDGFPTTAARVAMLSGCCLVGSNPTGEQSPIRPGEHYVAVPERDAGALVDALRGLKGHPEERRAIARRGADAVRDWCDVAPVVAAKLARMGFLTDADAGVVSGR